MHGLVSCRSHCYRTGTVARTVISSSRRLFDQFSVEYRRSIMHKKRNYLLDF